MKIFNKVSIISLLVFSLILGFTGPVSVLAATTPSLGAASSFGILGSTYTNTTAGTTINGDLGYTTLPAVAPTVNGTTHVADSAYNQAGIDQGTALTNLNNQVCTFTFAPGAIDLATDTTHGAIGVYAPGVYCTVGAASLGTGGITLSGNGTYIFRITGAFTTVANSVVTLAGGASACDIFWTPTSATTLGANSTFLGTDIDASGITIGSTVMQTGRSLAFGGTVTTNVDTITVPTCTPPPFVPLGGLATLHVVKQVVNNSGGTAVASNFNLHVKLTGVEITGSPVVGIVAPGTSYSLAAGTYVVSEDTTSLPYAQSFSGACNASGSVTLIAGTDVTCTVVNDDIEPVVIVPPVVVPPVVVPPLIVTPTLPRSGFPPQENTTPWNVIIAAGTLILFLASLVVVLRKHTI